MKILKFLCLVLFYMLPVHTWAQFNQVSVYPPEAASLMRNVDYPVGHLNGMPDIRIPLYTIKAGSLTLPLEISFHIDSYLRANQMPGSVGAGWSLSSELQISRTINGKDDLGAGGYCSNSTVPSNFSNNFPYQQRTRRQMKSMIDGNADEEPDKFYYQLLGKSGAFYFQKQADGSFKPIPVPFNGIKITYNAGQFKIIDTDGTTYIFSTTIRDWTDELFYITHIMAWKCEGVKNAAGVQEITFHYANNYQYLANSYNDRIEVYDDINSFVGFDGEYSIKSNPEGWDGSLTLPFWQVTGAKMLNYGGYSSSMLAFNRLNVFQKIGSYSEGTPSQSYNNVLNNLTTDITFRGGSVVFVYGTLKQLSTIQVKNSEGTTLKTISLTQSYTGSQGGTTYSNNASRHSRKLDMLQIDDQKYSFTYGFDRQFGDVYDFWGYKACYPQNDYCTVPYQNIDVSMGNCIRWYDGAPYDPYDPYNHLSTTIGNGPSIYDIFNLAQGPGTRAALSIIYPTGGKTEFIVGQNRFRDPVDETIKGAGGFRIEKIRYFDGISTNPVKEKIYKYGPNEDGTGIIKAMPSFDPFSGNCFLDETNTYVSSDVGEINSTRKRIYLSGSTRSLTFSNGSPVNYNEVAEYNSDMGVVTGKTVYKYDLYYYSPEYTSPTDPFPLERNDWDIGMPDSVIQYKKYKDGQIRWVKRKNMDYNKFTDPYQIFTGRTLLRGNHILIGDAGSGPNQDWYTEFEGNMQYKSNGITTGVMQLVSEDESQRDDDGNIITSRTNYSYNNPDPSVVSRIENTGSDGITNIQNITYPLDYLSGGFIDSLIFKNIVSPPVERISLRNGKVVSGQISIYNPNGTVASTYQVESNQLNQNAFKLSNRASTGDYSMDKTANVAFNRDPSYIPKLTLGWESSYLNLQQISPTDNIPTTYLWGYSKTYPVAKIVNASLEQVTTALGGTLPDMGLGGLNDAYIYLLRLNLPYAQITTYTYTLLVGMTSQTDPKGMTTFYEYDNYQRLKSIKDQSGNIIKGLDYHYKQ